MNLNSKTYIIAEAGVNHNGSLSLAKKLIDVAVNAGADAVKFQTFSAENLVGKQTAKADYQKENTARGESQYEMLKRLELSQENHIELMNYCKQKKIDFLSTPFDLNSIKLLCELGLNTLKIPSGEITNLPYLREIGKANKKIILSTGMSTLNEIKDALDILVQAGTPKSEITVLHTNTEYPTPYEDVNLNAMLTIAQELGVRVGYSDHTLGIEISIAAVAQGASIIEKHFTLSRTLNGPDHKSSLEPEELSAMVYAIRNVEKAMGNGIKRASKSEGKNIRLVRKSIVASRAIKKGEVFTEENITTKRPATGISPMKWDEIINSIATCDYNTDDLIKYKEPRQ